MNACRRGRLHCYDLLKRAWFLSYSVSDNLLRILDWVAHRPLVGAVGLCDVDTENVHSATVILLPQRLHLGKELEERGSGVRAREQHQGSPGRLEAG